MDRYLDRSIRPDRLSNLTIPQCISIAVIVVVVVVAAAATTAAATPPPPLPPQARVLG